MSLTSDEEIWRVSVLDEDAIQRSSCEDVRTNSSVLARMSRGCHEETAVVELARSVQLYNSTLSNINGFSKLFYCQNLKKLAMI